MELATELDQTQAKLNDNSVIYRAVGWVAGIFQPDENKRNQGVLVTQDGVVVPAHVTHRLQKRIKKKYPDYMRKPDLFKQAYCWAVYPQTEPLQFKLVQMKPLPTVDTAENVEPQNNRELDQFRIVGEIASCCDGMLTVTVRRNELPPKGKEEHLLFQPFNLKITGDLPTEAVGQIWDLLVRRSGETFVIVAGHPYDPASDRGASVIKQQQRLTVDVAVSKEKETKSSNQTVPNAIGATTGKMEVVVKLNEFPDDVRTLDNGLKEFSVDTGNQLVKITVKPKAFAQLEQAQQTGTMWVAAISGQMSQLTATGFKLEFPAIKVFERKAKETSRDVTPTTSNDNTSPPAKEHQPLPLETEITQQQALQPQTEPEQSPSPSANPMQAVKENLKQQRPAKTPNQLSNKQELSQSKPGGKQRRASASVSSPQSQKPAFQVKVNGQVFSGHDSVTLNNRMLRIDGKPVVQAKMAIVVGQPKTIQADSGVTRSGDQAVLISR